MANHGMCCSFDDAIAWAERQPDSTVKECALNRMRYERDKALPVKPKFHKGIYGRKYDSWSCGQCGATISEADWNYCPKCGYMIGKKVKDEQT